MVEAALSESASLEERLRMEVEQAALATSAAESSANDLAEAGLISCLKQISHGLKSHAARHDMFGQARNVSRVTLVANVLNGFCVDSCFKHDVVDGVTFVTLVECVNDAREPIFEL
eukprot:5257350-Amphidinium_carterae.1